MTVKELFKRSMGLDSMITDLAGKCDVISIEVNSAMKVYIKHGRKNDEFLAMKYLELVEDLARYGIIEKEWKDD